MQNISYQKTDRVLLTTKEIHYGIPHVQKFITVICFRRQTLLGRITMFYKKRLHFVDTLSRRTNFWDTAVPCRSEETMKVVNLNPDGDK